jgi:hypothetical protein
MDEWVQAYAACWDGVVYCFLEPCPRLMIRAPVQDVCTLVRLNFV